MITSLNQMVVGGKYHSKQHPQAVYMCCLDVKRKTKFVVVIEDTEEYTDPEDICLGHKVDFSFSSVEWFRFYPAEE